ncbi:Flp family type IVb pilin [Trinickia terrae]|uniref:Flp family type IVb pilin n=1 Tax=Trinickia terrae TaxID=2571161 RepID=A0A4U1HX85_9BURK|nr:Flp family type IVb pilin [Trinickia terrae]TKC86261.1 Flp family type IVb pilin [Trinickia terrae]
MLQLIKSLARDERGVSALEYAVLAGIIVVAVVGAGSVLSGSSGLSSLFTTLMTKISSAI